MNWNNGKKNTVLALISVVLVLVLGGILVVDHKSTSKETEQLTELAEKEKKGIEDYESVKKRASELAEQLSESEEERGSQDQTSEKETSKDESEESEEDSKSASSDETKNE